jgi:hypothetical protein
MNTIYDFVTVALFAGLTVLFLQRSVQPEPRDRMILYLPPAIGCMLANWLGNNHQDLLAAALILGVVGYVFVVLQPFQRTP